MRLPFHLRVKRVVCGQAACGLLHRWGPGWGCVCSEALCHWTLRKRSALEEEGLEEACCPDFPATLTHLTNLGSSTLWVFGLLGYGVITTYLFCTPSCNRQRRSSGRWMRPSPCSRRCCDPPIPTLSPPCSINRDGSNKIFCQHLLLFVWCEQGVGRGVCRGLAWGLPGAAGELPAPARPWVLVGSGMCLPGSVSGTVPGLSHGALLPAPCLPSSPRCAVAAEARPGPAPAFATSCGPGLA